MAAKLDSSFLSKALNKIGFKKKDPKEGDVGIKKIAGYAAFSKPSFEYLPYACHYNKDTIITKNGEMLQVIRIDYDDVIKSFDGTTLPDIRTEIRNSIKEVVDNMDYIDVSFYIQTIRDSVDFTYRRSFEKNFMEEVEDFWISRNSLSKEYKNSIFITVVIAGLGNKFDIKNYLGFLFFSVIKLKFVKHFKFAFDRLSSVTSSILAKLSFFNPSLLTCVKKDGVYYSELISFFTRLSFLDCNMRALENKDISHYFSFSKIAFGYNEFEIYNEEEKSKKIGSILEFKASRSIDAATIKKIFDTNAATLITECILFEKGQKIKKKFEQEKNLIAVSEDSNVLTNSEMEEILENDYCINNVVTIMVIGRNQEELSSKMIDLVSEISHAGYSVFRHNIKLEQTYWLQLPGNFSFITNKSPTIHKNICSLAHISFDLQDEKNTWGSPVAIFSDATGERFKFNFRHGGKSSAFVLGDRVHANTFVNFLSSSALRSNVVVYSLDQDIKNSFFIKAQGGRVFNIGFDESQFNPFCVSEENAEGEIYELIKLLSENKLSEDLLIDLAKKVTSVDKKIVNYKFVFGLIKDQSIKDYLLSKYDGLFSEENKNFFDENISTHFFINPEIKIDNAEILLKTLLKKIEIQNNTTEVRRILIIRDSGLFSHFNSIEEILEKLILQFDNKKNSIIFVPQDYDDHCKKGFLQNVLKFFNTHILFGDESSRERHQDIKYFDKYVVDRARWISNEGKKEFIMIRGKEVVNLRFDLSDVKYRKIFYPQGEDINALEKSFSSGKDIDEWIKDLYLQDV